MASKFLKPSKKVSMRIQVLEDGKILPGQEERFQKSIEKEAVGLKEIWNREKEVHPKLYENISEPNWQKEARDSIICASYRFGNGSFWVEEP